MALTIGIVGLPNAGKSTLFNALTKNDVLAANYPFATIEPNVGVVGVPDPRLGMLAKIFGSARTLPATVEFVDIAGIVRGASEGEGLGNKFLSHIRESAAICQVTRVFRDEDVTHVDGEVNPASDISTIQTEMILADLQTVEKALPRLEKEARIKKESAAALTALRQAKEALESGTPIIASNIDRSLLRELQLLTAKPFIYVFNCDADELADEDLKARMRALVAPSEAIFLDAKFESELVELGDDDEARAMLAEMGVDEPGLDVLARVGFDTLGLQTYLTAGPQGVAGLDDPEGRHRARGRRRDPHRLPARLHQGRDRVVRRPDRGRLDGCRQGGRQGPHGGQGLRDGRRRRRGVPLRTNIYVEEVLSRTRALAKRRCGARRSGIIVVPCPEPLEPPAFTVRLHTEPKGRRDGGGVKQCFRIRIHPGRTVEVRPQHAPVRGSSAFVYRLSLVGIDWSHENRFPSAVAAATPFDEFGSRPPC